MLNAGTLLDNRYVIEDKIGQGGMSYVYRAQDTKLGRVVAVKVLKEEFAEDEEFIRKFKNEAKAAAKLAHPNIVAAYDVVDEGELHYIVMELVEGITLKNYIARKGMLSNKETIGIALQAAAGIGEAHKKEIIHRDIKPQNMIISKDGKVKVADFGIAKAVTGETVNASVIGSVHYISPEQARSGVADARSDLYSLGISMYEMITGRVPYEGENTVNVVMAHLSEAMVPPAVYNSDIYPALNDIILKACRKKPEERYQTAEELIADLKRAVREPEGHFVKLGETEPAGQAAAEADTAGKEGGTAAGTESGGDSRESLQRPESAGAETGGEEAQGQEPPRKEREDQIQRLMKFGSIGAGAIILVIVAMILANLSGLFSAFSTAPTQAVTRETAAETEESSSEEMDYKISIQGEDLMPDLVGKTVAEAQARLGTMGISLDSSQTAFSDTYYEGMIIEQDPEPEEAVIPGITVHVTVSLGTKISYTLNHIADSSLSEAKEALLDAGLGEPEVIHEYSDTTARGSVIRWQAAEEGSEVKEGDTVTLVVSDGKEPEQVRVPIVSSLTQEGARSTLEAAGLKLGAVTQEPSDQTAGLVIRQLVEPNQLVQPGTEVPVVVSSGPQQTGEAAGPGVVESTMPQAQAQENAAEPREEEPAYYGSIDTVCSAGLASGPNAQNEYINIQIRLVQRGPDSYEYVTLQDLNGVPAGTEFPVSFPSIKGIYGVETGKVQVINSDTGELLGSYDVTFAPR